MAEKEISYFKEAVYNQYNIIIFIGFLAFAVLGSEPLVLVLWLGLELLYLTFIPGSAMFKNHVQQKIDKQKQQEQVKKRGQVLMGLTETSRKKFYSLKQIHDQIMNSPTLKDESLAPLWRDQIEKLNTVLDSYLNMQFYLQNFETTFSDKKLKEVEDEIRKLEKEIKDPNTTDKVKEIKEQRLDILKKRFEKIKRAAGEREATEEQIKVIEETVKYTYEQITSVKDPRTVSDQLDSILISAEVSESTMRDIMDSSDWSK